jgi:hypothetical protein
MIEIQPAEYASTMLRLQPGDLLLARASGGRVLSGASVLEMLGPFVPAVVGDNGEIFVPAGSPNSVLFYARGTGQAVVDIVVGDPWRAPQTFTLQISVEP